MKNIFLFALSLIILAIFSIVAVNTKLWEKSDSAEIITIQTTIENHRFKPAIIHVPRGTKIRLVVYNHDDTVEEFESNDLHREKIIMPKSSINIILAPLQPGKYDFFGDFNQDTAQGSLIVD